jgi:hypothetical protein
MHACEGQAITKAWCVLQASQPPVRFARKRRHRICYKSRLTRCGEFPPFEWLFTLGSFFIAEVAQMFGLLFSTVKYSYRLWQKMVWATYILAFFTIKTFLSKSMHTCNLQRWKKEPQNVGYFCKLQKLPKVNNHELGEFSPKSCHPDYSRE